MGCYQARIRFEEGLDDCPSRLEHKGSVHKQNCTQPLGVVVEENVNLQHTREGGGWAQKKMKAVGRAEGGLTKNLTQTRSAFLGPNPLRSNIPNS